MGVGDVGGGPKLPPPGAGSLTQVGDQAVGAAIGVKNQVVDKLTSAKDQINLKQNQIDNIKADNPVLTASRNLSLSIDNSRQIKGNPWLNANPWANLTINYLEITAALSKIALLASFRGADAIDLMAALAKDNAQLTRDLGQLKFIANMVSGIVNLGKGAINIAGGIAAGTAGSQSLSMALSTGTQGVAGAFGSIDDFSKAFVGLFESEKEAEKVINENMQKVADRMLQTAGDSVRTNKEMLSEFLQTLTKILSEGYKGHTLGRG